MSVIVKEAVRNDEGTFLVHYVLEFIECNRQAASLEVNFFRSAEP